MQGEKRKQALGKLASLPEEIAGSWDQEEELPCIGDPVIGESKPKAPVRRAWPFEKLEEESVAL